MYSCSRTKIEVIFNDVIAPNAVQSVLNDIEKQGILYIGVATDGNGHGAIKLFPIVVQYFNWKKGGLQSKLLEVKNTTNKLSITIVTEVKETLNKKGLLQKCVFFIGDNCNINFGGVQKKLGGNDVFFRFK